MTAALKAIGVDVSSSRGCAIVGLGTGGKFVASSWADSTPESVIAGVRELTERHGSCAIGIDSPRRPLLAAREWYCRDGRWRRGSPTDKGNGRHCEIAIAALRLANPQWTPLAADAPDWMQLGFALFDRLESEYEVLEIFPTASYAQLGGTDLTLELGLTHVLRGAKDVMDAGIGALTVIEYLAGRGSQVGNGDGLGAIILPRPVTNASHPALTWPC